MIGDDNDDVFDAAVVVARQLCDAASPGQILVSEMIEHLLRRRNDVTFATLDNVNVDSSTDLGPVYQVVWELAAEQPPARTVVADDAGLLRAGIVTLWPPTASTSSPKPPTSTVSSKPSNVTDPTC